MLHGVDDSLDGVASLAGLKKLRTLALIRFSTVAGEFPEGLDQLTELRLECQGLSSLKLIRHLKHLERLNLDGYRSLLDFSVLKDLPRLKWLSLGNCRWTDPQLLEDLLARGIEIRYLETLDFSLSLNPNYKPTSLQKPKA